MQDLYLQDDYKAVLRLRVKELRDMSLRKLAELVRVQHTYFSRVLNSDSLHLSDDVLFEMCHHLAFDDEAREYVMLLRARQATTSPRRRQMLDLKLTAFRQRKKVRAAVRTGEEAISSPEMAYLLDPYAILVHVSLYVPEYRRNLARLAEVLGLARSRLDTLLRKLADADLIVLDAKGDTVVDLRSDHLHFDTTHPMMRAHQALVRQIAGARLFHLPEENKNSFLAVFTGDDTTLASVRMEFNKFIGQVQLHAEKAKAAQPYYLQFDFFRWT